MRFKDPVVAGRELAGLLTAFRNARDTIVLGIASGGVPVASVLAHELQLPWDLLFIRRLTAPFGPQQVLCATNVGGTLVVDDELLPLPEHPVTGMDFSVAAGIKELVERERFCREGREPIDLGSKKVVVADNGIHTGSTVLIAIRALRKLSARRIVLAAPVADPASRDVIEAAASEVVCLAWPEKFGHAGLWYEEFVRPTDEQILNLYRETINS